MTILTSCSNQWNELHDLTFPNKKEFCDKYCFDIIDHRIDINQSRGWWWYRAQLWLDEVRKVTFGEYVWFLGADTLIMNMALDPLEFIIKNSEDIIIGLDVNGVNSDSALFRHTDNTIKVLERVLALNGREQNEQDALQRTLGEKLCDVKILPQRYLNSYLYEFYRRDHPNDLGGTYEEGDLILHFPGLPYEKKLELTRQYLPKVIR